MPLPASFPELASLDTTVDEHHFSQIAIGGKADRQEEREPGDGTAGNDQVEHAQRGKDDRRNAPGPERFPKHNDADRNTHERVDVIPQRGLKDLTVIDRINEGPPVHADQGRGPDQGVERPPVLEDIEHSRKPPGHP